jgi:hypothetical protein
MLAELHVHSFGITGEIIAKEVLQMKEIGGDRVTDRVSALVIVIILLMYYGYTRIEANVPRLSVASGNVPASYTPDPYFIDPDLSAESGQIHVQMFHDYKRMQEAWFYSLMLQGWLQGKHGYIGMTDESMCRVAIELYRSSGGGSSHETGNR